MPLGFLSDEEIDERVESENNLVNLVEYHAIKNNRKDSVNTPPEIKKVIAILGNEEDSGTQSSLARSFNVSDTVVSHAVNGKRDDGSIDNDLKDVIAETKAKVEGKRLDAEKEAVDKLFNAIGLIDIDQTSTKADLKRAKSVTTIAKDLATIANQVSKRGDGKFGNEDDEKKPRIVFYVPEMAKLNDYEVVDGEVVK